jgi:site-specific DNA recombinase
MNHSTNGKPIRAATYFRMSKDEQENSIARQQGQGYPYAARLGYELTREYKDEGIAGWKSGDDRPDFQRMLQDAQRGLFSVILCDDVDRFGRFDMHKYGAVVDRLRDAGVRLETVAQGPIDWDDTLSQINDAIRMVFKREQSNDTARRILTRFIQMAKEGKWVAGTIPYGYAKDPKTLHLIPGDPHKVEVVQWIFRTYAERDVFLRWLAEELHRRGVPNPSDKPNKKGEYRWTGSCLGKLLRNRNYLGDLHWNKAARGEFQEVIADKVVKRKEKGQKRRGEADLIIVPSTHPALIDRDTFEKVQARLDGNLERRTPQRGGGNWLLSGLLVCGHCGAPLVGKSNWGSNVKKRKPIYVCNAYMRWGKTACQCHYVYEAPMLDVLIRKLQREFLNPDNLAKLREELKRQSAKTNRSEASQLARLKRRIEAIDKDVADGNKNMARAKSADAIEGIASTIREWRAERDQLARQLADLERGAEALPTETEIALAEQHLWTLREGLEQEDPTLVRAVLREMVDRVELWWDHHQAGAFIKTRFTRGLIYLKQDEQISYLVNATLVAPLATRLQPKRLARLRVGDALARAVPSFLATAHSPHAATDPSNARR